jgi:hypothetical protein
VGRPAELTVPEDLIELVRVAADGHTVLPPDGWSRQRPGVPMTLSTGGG